MARIVNARSICAVLLAVAAASPASEFRVRQQRVEVLSQGEVVLKTPAEGLWSVACEWREDWPAAWRHAAPQEIFTEGPWTILRG
ncbi:MAG: hypothetical protein ACP5U2_12385, partial [Bryobacteraceae bacterium]